MDSLFKVKKVQVEVLSAPGSKLSNTFLQRTGATNRKQTENKRMGFTKKTGKGRLDKYYFLAKDQGYRARSAFKLVQLHQKYNILDDARVVLDLCAAPGGWLQVASKYMPISKVIIGVDLAAIKPIEGVKTIQADITGEKCRSELKKELKGWKADVVLHDGAPNVGSSWIHDAFSQSELVLHSLKLATEFLQKGGTFVTKVFRSKDYNSLLWVFNQLFEKVDSTKPASSRSVSAEIFVVCRGYRAPPKVDPRFLDPKYVFEEILMGTNGNANGNPNQTAISTGGGPEQDLLHPEKRKRHRDGYEDGVTMLYKAIPLSTFLLSPDPNRLLASASAFSLDDKENLSICPEWPKVKEAISLDVKESCSDLKVLGKREFKLLSRFRKMMRSGVIVDCGHDSPQESSSKDKDNKDDKDDDNNKDKDDNKEDDFESYLRVKERQVKRARRKVLERKAKERLRMGLGMNCADDLAQEMTVGEQLFALGDNDNILLDNVGDEDAGNVCSDNDNDDDGGGGDGSCDDIDSDSSSLSSDDDEESSFLAMEAGVAGELYRSDLRLREKQKDSNPVEYVKGSRAKDDDDDDNDDNDEEFSESDSESESEIISAVTKNNNSASSQKDKSLLTSLLSKEEELKEKEAKRALWYSNPIFRHLEDGDGDGSVDTNNHKNKNNHINNNQNSSDDESKGQQRSKKKKAAKGNKKKVEKEEKVAVCSIEFVPSDFKEKNDDDDGDCGGGGAGGNQHQEEMTEKELRLAKEQIMTPSGMTLASKLALNKKSAKRDIADDSYNRYVYRDEGKSLPAWFVEDEGRNNKPQKPVTKEGIAILKEKMKQLDAQPIKKVAEARGRMQRRSAKKIESLKAKASVIAESEDIGERQKSEQISKLMAKAKKSSSVQRAAPKLVISVGKNRGIKGRPKGTKGHYRMVDNRMKKELRAVKRVQIKRKAGRKS